MYNTLLSLCLVLACVNYYVENKKTYNKLFLLWAIVNFIRSLFSDNTLRGGSTSFILFCIEVGIFLLACVVFLINLKKENKNYK